MSWAGTVIEFVAEAAGESWVYLRWNISDIRDDLDRYSILIDEDYSDTVGIWFLFKTKLSAMWQMMNIQF